MLAQLQSGERIEQFDSVRLSKLGGVIDVSLSISPLIDGEAKVVGASVVARNISERKATEVKTALLLGELDHRVKNILQIVSAVVQQTLKNTPDPEAFAVEVDGRIKAIASAHSLLTEAGQGALSLRAIIETELKPYGGDKGAGKNRLVIEGPDIDLAPKAGMSLAMAVHELASNAAKYGALSASAGRLNVTWDVVDTTDPPTLTLVWTEADGPRVQPPTRRGFGTILIERTLKYELDAEVTRDFQPTGLHCTFALPLTADVGRLLAAGQINRARDDDR